MARPAGPGTSPDRSEVEDLKLQVRILERLIAQRTLEIVLLKELLEKDRDDES